MTRERSDAPPQLESAHLDGLERRWRQQGWPGVDRLRPGLSANELDAATMPLGLELPQEARRWWGWHDGVELPRDATREHQVFGGPGFLYLSLFDAVGQYKTMRDIARTLVEVDSEGVTEDQLWHPSWFPITIAENGAVVACDCSDPRSELTPIRPVHWATQVTGRIRAGSLGEMLTWWLDAIDSGAWWYDRNEDQWMRDSTELDPQRELTRLV